MLINDVFNVELVAYELVQLPWFVPQGFILFNSQMDECFSQDTWTPNFGLF